MSGIASAAFPEQCRRGQPLTYDLGWLPTQGHRDLPRAGPAGDGSIADQRGERAAILRRSDPHEVISKCLTAVLSAIQGTRWLNCARRSPELAR